MSPAQNIYKVVERKHRGRGGEELGDTNYCLRKMHIIPGYPEIKFNSLTHLVQCNTSFGQCEALIAVLEHKNTELLSVVFLYVSFKIVTTVVLDVIH